MLLARARSVAPLVATATLATACVTDLDPAAPPAAQPLADRGTAYLRTAQGVLPVAYERDGDWIVFQGDMMVRADEFARNVVADPADAGDPDRAAVCGAGSTRWTHAEIPYRYAADLSTAMRHNVDAAIAEWQAKTPFTFHQRAASEPDYITFRPGTGTVCTSAIGRQGGEQFITLPGGCDAGRVMHEIGHAVGFFHEQARSDRDAYVQINWDNIDPGQYSQFYRYADLGWDGADAGFYDYGSIMHYGDH